MQIKLNNLSAYEREILERILNKEVEPLKNDNPMAHPTVGYMAWVNLYGDIDMGPIRWGCKNNYTTEHGRENSWSASPFSGAWEMVPLSRIVRVRHADTIF